MGSKSCLNENPVRIIVRTERTADLTTRKVLGNISEGELIYDEDANRLYVCTQSTEGSIDGVIVQVGV